LPVASDGCQKLFGLFFRHTLAWRGQLIKLALLILVGLPFLRLALAALLFLVLLVLLLFTLALLLALILLFLSFLPLV
jgi:hypothetical protein